MRKLRVSAVQAASTGEAAPVNHRIAVFLAAVALGCSLAALAGWTFAWPALRGFGFSRYPIWPWTTLGFAALSLGFLFSLHERPKLAMACWSVPLTIALVSLFERWSGVDLGVDRLLFPNAVAAYPMPMAGRTGINPATVFLLLVTAGLSVHLRNWLSREAGSLIATIALGLAAATAIIILFSHPGNRELPLLATSIPAAVMSVTLALSFIARNSGFGWVRDLLRDRSNRRVLRILLPAALFLPVLPTLLEITVARRGTFSPMVSELLVVLCNVLVVAAIAYWAVTRVAREQSAQIELSQALDATMIAITDLDGRVLHWSRGAEELYGWTPAEAEGQYKYALLRSRCQSWGQDLPRRGDGDMLELVEVARDGREITVLEHVHRVTTPGRDPVLVLKMTDVSERVQALEELRESEERLAIATATHEVGVFEWDIASGRINWSPGAEQRLGIVPGSIASFESWRAQVDPSDVEEVMQTIERTVADRADRFGFRYRFLHPNGNVRAVEGSARAFYDSGGQLVRAVGAILDITEREEREAALRRREAQLRSIIETVPDAMLVMDEEGTIRVFSAAAEDLWGYKAREVLGQNFTMLSPATERARHAGLLHQFIRTGEWSAPGEMISATGETADGRRFPVEIRAGVAHVDGRMLFTLFARDISERLATEERMGELNADLAHVSRQIAMSELAADMAHELNQPLSASTNFLAAARMLIDKGEDRSRVTDLLRMAAEQTLRAGEIIRRLRSFTIRGEVDMREEPLAATIRDAVELVLVGTSQFHIRLTYELDPEAPVIFADRVQIQQVLVNLLRNSVEILRQVGGPDRRIIIRSTKVSEEMVEIEIVDNGPGIPETILNQLFSRFTTTKRASSGMGIGLSISKRIIEAHGGTLSADNRPEGGAVFRFTLPVVEQDGV